VLKFLLPSDGISTANAGTLANAKPVAASAIFTLVCMISPPLTDSIAEIGEKRECQFS
jgi:hypothetical protein